MIANRVVIVGNGRMAQTCAGLLLRHSVARLELLVAEQRADSAHARLAQFCARENVPLLTTRDSVNTSDVIARIAATRPDIVFSIDNFQVFGAALLATPARGCINFHNGPIERYRGVNIPSWAIFNGEREHGITWHYMEPTVDSGAIAASAGFALTGSETALALTLECIRVGVEAFEQHLSSILAGARRSVALSPDARLYRRTEVPNGGSLDLRAPAASIDRLLRATDFRPLPNTFAYARLACPRGHLIVNEAKALGPSAGFAPGEIVSAGDELIVACADRLLSLTAVMLAPDEPIDVADAVRALALTRGQSLA